eukprot:489222_1
MLEPSTSSSIPFSTMAQQNEDLVFGYLREAEIMGVNVPHPIYFMCLAYFETDYFAEGGPYIVIANEDGCSTATYTSDNYSWNSCFGHLCIDSMDNTTHSWTFKVVESKSGGNMCIGIDNAHITDVQKSELKVHGYGFHYKTKNAYGLKCNGVRFSGNSTNYQNEDGDHGITYERGDTVVMELDLMQRTLTYTIHPMDATKPTKTDRFEEIKQSNVIKYRIAMTTFYTSDSIQLVEYNRKSFKF